MTDDATGGTDTPRWRQRLRPGARGPDEDAGDAQRQAVERAHRHRAGDAAPGQLDHHVHQARPASACDQDVERAGSRRAPTRPGFPLKRGSPAGSPRRSTASRAAPGRAVRTSAPRASWRCGDRGRPEHGVIDPYQRVYGYPTLVGDGRRRSRRTSGEPVAGLTAQAERAASLWPNKASRISGRVARD